MDASDIDRLLAAADAAPTTEDMLPFLKELVAHRLPPQYADSVAQVLDQVPGIMADAEDGSVWVAEHDPRTGQVYSGRSAAGGRDYARATRAGLRYVTRGRTPSGAIAWALRLIPILIECGKA